MSGALRGGLYFKISVGTDEADETLFWFELLAEAELVNEKVVELLWMSPRNY
jgi:hypothetical protein